MNRHPTENLRFLIVAGLITGLVGLAGALAGAGMLAFFIAGMLAAFVVVPWKISGGHRAPERPPEG